MIRRLLILTICAIVLLASCTGQGQDLASTNPEQVPVDDEIVVITLTFQQTGPGSEGVVSIEAWEGVVLQYPIGHTEDGLFYVRDICNAPCEAQTIDIENAYLAKLDSDGTILPLPCLLSGAQYFVDGNLIPTMDEVSRHLGNGSLVTMTMQCKR